MNGTPIVQCIRRGFMRYAALVLLLFVIGAQATSVAPPVRQTPVVESTPAAVPEITRDWAVNIVLVGYDPTVIDEAVLLDGLPIERMHSSKYAKMVYNVHYAVHYANASYTERLRQLIEDNSVSGTDIGTAINESALEYQKEHPDEPQSVFYPRDGMEIDGYVVEDWLEANPAVAPPALGYTLYLLNFSEFDAPDHSFEHWYDYHPVDPDTGETQDWFRLEWENDLNPSVKFEYPGFGGREKVFVLDPSADQWYLRWARVWWGDPPYPSDYEHCTMDLEDKVATLDLSTPAGREALGQYLHDYMYDAIAFLFMPTQHRPLAYVPEGLFRGLVFCMDVDEGVPVDSLTWVTNAEVQRAHLEELVPFINWTVKVDFLDIHDYPAWESLFWDYAYVDNGTTHVDGINMFNAIWDDMRPQYVDINDTDVNTFGVVFIKKQMLMHYSGRTFTGLGGRNQTVIWKSWERYYRPDGVTPKSGISSVQLHETMHALGFHHTWTYHHYVGDFSYSPMGYFAFHNGTSTFDQDWAQCTYVDQMRGQVVGGLEALVRGAPSPLPTNVEYVLTRVLRLLNASDDLYNRMDWRGAYAALQEAQAWLETLELALEDSEPPTFAAWALDTHPSAPLTLVATVNVTDNYAGVKNVTLHLVVDGHESTYVCVPAGGTGWTAEVAGVGPATVTYWFEAYDRALNVALSPTATFNHTASTTMTTTTTTSTTTTGTTTPTGGSNTTSQTTGEGGWDWTWLLSGGGIILTTTVVVVAVVVIVIVARRRRV